MVTAHVREVMAVPMVGLMAGARLARIHRRHGARASNAGQRDCGGQQADKDCLPIMHGSRIRLQNIEVKPLPDPTRAEWTPTGVKSDPFPNPRPFHRIRPHAQNPGASVVVQPHPHPRTETMAHVMDSARQAGVTRVPLAAES